MIRTGPWFHADDEGKRADEEFESPGHLLAYLVRVCPSDRMGCGACPKSGCDHNRLRIELSQPELATQHLNRHKGK